VVFRGGALLEQHLASAVEHEDRHRTVQLAASVRIQLLCRA
jgi:hypothetical protein